MAAVGTAVWLVCFTLLAAGEYFSICLHENIFRMVTYQTNTFNSRMFSSRYRNHDFATILKIVFKISDEKPLVPAAWGNVG